MKRYSIIAGAWLLTALAGACSSEPAPTTAPKPAAAPPEVSRAPSTITDSVVTTPQPTAGAPAHHTANEHMNAKPFEELVASFDDPARLQWQQPKQVIRTFGPLKGKTVLDIGAGTGYFSFPLVRMGARVISGDIDDRFLQLLEERKAAQLLTDAQLVTRKLAPDSPGLAAEEVDIALLVDVYHHLENRPAYFRKVRDGLKPGGRVIVIDFKKKETPVGPPLAMRLTPAEIGAELKAAGFARQEVEEQLLPYQYILTAYK